MKDLPEHRVTGNRRKPDLQAHLVMLGAIGLSKRQARPIAKAYNAQVMEPVLSKEAFQQIWRDAWAELEAEEREQHFKELMGVEKGKADFLLYPYIPLGSLTIMDGDPGMGKSLVTAALASIVTTGGRFPNGERVGKGRVLFLSPEDEPDRILRPRMEAHGGKIGKVRFMDKPFLLDGHGIELLRRELRHHGSILAVIDPLSAFIPETVDMYRANESRGFMRPLAMLAREMNIAIVVVRHLRKASTDSAIQRGQGSMDFIASVRSGLAVLGHPSDPETRVFAQTKANYSKTGPTIAFEVQAIDDGSTPKIKWNGVIDQTADQLMQVAKKSTPIERAEAMISDWLSAGEMLARTAIDRLVAAGFSERTIDRAKDNLRVVSGRGPGAKWKLP
jgi:AAA domain